MLEADDSQYNYTITHFADKEKQSIVSKPALGRMKLWESIKPVDNDLMNEILKIMRHTWVTIPLLFANQPAFAALADLSASDVATGAPEAISQAAKATADSQKYQTFQ